LVRKIFFFFGLIISLAALYQLFPLLGEYGALADYGKGYVWGNLVILGIGAVIMAFSFKGFKSNKKTQ
jgi:hypothetical protein